LISDVYFGGLILLAFPTDGFTGDLGFVSDLGFAGDLGFVGDLGFAGDLGLLGFAGDLDFPAGLTRRLLTTTLLSGEWLSRTGHADFSFTFFCGPSKTLILLVPLFCKVFL
jgi:hypothetical protein